MVISELVANSFEHGRGTIQLAIEHRVAAIHGSVTDDEPRVTDKIAKLTGEEPFRATTSRASTRSPQRSTTPTP